MLERYPEFVAWRSQSKGGEAAEQDAARGTTRRRRSLRVSSCSTPSSRATSSGGCIRSVRPSSSASSSICWCGWATAAAGSRWAGRSAGSATGASTASSRRTSSASTSSMSRPSASIPTRPCRCREVRDFVGGLEGHRATKGVFVTTSYFPTTAYDFITRVSKRVVLIDGQALASLMIRHRVGVRVKDVYEVERSTRAISSNRPCRRRATLGATSDSSHTPRLHARAASRTSKRNAPRRGSPHPVEAIGPDSPALFLVGRGPARHERNRDRQ